jgi:hypothetical protein
VEWRYLLICCKRSSGLRTSDLDKRMSSRMSWPDDRRRRRFRRGAGSRCVTAQRQSVSRLQHRMIRQDNGFPRAKLARHVRCAVLERPVGWGRRGRGRPGEVEISRTAASGRCRSGPRARWIAAAAMRATSTSVPAASSCTSISSRSRLLSASRASRRCLKRASRWASTAAGLGRVARPSGCLVKSSMAPSR